jgi:hypothetical protein
MQPCKFAAIVSAAALAGCAGSGEGLDENGRPIGEEQQAPPALTAQLSSIQANVFTPICTTCHSGSAAPLGFRLEADVAYSMLVNAPSVEVPSLMRVAPGNPDASYLVQKLEGTAQAGARMPLNGQPLPAEVIAVIRQWIVDGAPASVSAPSVLPTQLKAAWPMQDAVVAATQATIVLESSAELDASSLNAGTVTLMRTPLSGEVASAAMEPRIVLRSLDPSVLAIAPVDGHWSPGRYELRLSGSSPLSVAGRDARPIDGDADGQAGGDFLLRFEVEAPR